MFGFTRHISRGRYALAMGGRVGLFIAVTFAFPFLVWAVIEASGARGTGGASGALAVVLGIYLKPLIYLLFSASLLRPSMRRAASLGMSVALGLGVVLLALGDLRFGIVFGAHWGVGFSLGVLRLSLPWLLMAALVAALTLGLLRVHEDDRSAAERLGVAYRTWLALFCALTIVAALMLLPVILILTMGKNAAPLLMGVGKYLSLLQFLQPMYLFFLFAAASAWLVAVDRGGSFPAPPQLRPQPRPAPSSPARGPGGGASFGRRTA